VLSEIRYEFGDTVPEPGTAMEVAPGVKWLRMPLQLTGLSHINLWLIRDGAGWTLVDTGMKNDLIESLWLKAFETVLDGLPIVRVIATHHHPDHVGLAGWLCEHFGAPLWMTRREWLTARMFWLDGRDEPPAFYLDHYRRVGFSDAALDEIRKRGYANFRLVAKEPPGQYRRIVDGEEIDIGGRAFRVVAGYGHAPEHACLWCPELNLMLSGDQILPKITPHIGVYPGEPEANPLQEYIHSLDLYRGLPADILLLPAHNAPFRGLHARLDYLARHHADRLTVLEELCSEPKRAMSTLKVLYRRMLKPHETFLGIGEAIAHLNCLIEQGRLVRETDAAGIWTFRRSGQALSAA